MRTDRTAYADMTARRGQVFHGLDAATPIAGFYRMRLRAGTIRVGIKVWYGPPHDPVTGEELDRSWRWQAISDDGTALDMEHVWPVCANDPITEADFTARQRRRTWAEKAAPESAYADAQRRYDPLDSRNPLPF